MTPCPILNQLGRRNVDDKTAALLRGQLYNSEKKAVPNPEGAGGKSGKIVEAHSDTQQTTAEKVAAQTGGSPATIKRDAKLAQAALLACRRTAWDAALKMGELIIAEAKAGRLATRDKNPGTLAGKDASGLPNRHTRTATTADLGITRKERAEATHGAATRSSASRLALGKPFANLQKVGCPS